MFFTLCNMRLLWIQPAGVLRAGKDTHTPTYIDSETGTHTVSHRNQHCDVLGVRTSYPSSWEVRAVSVH